jgi:signal transduction histidine kinase
LVESPRRRWPFFAISALGLFAGLWAMQGFHPLSALPPGMPVRPEPQSPFYIAIVLAEGLIFLAVNLLVFAPRADRVELRDLYWCTLLFGLATMIHGIHFPRSRAWSDLVPPLLWITCLTLLPVFFFRMTQNFPRPRRTLDRHPGLVRALWIAAAILIVWQGVAYLWYFRDPRPAVWAGTHLPRFLAEAFLASAIALGCVTLYRSGRRHELSREREQTKWILWGLTLGVAPYVFLRALPALAGFKLNVPLEVDRLFELAIPVALTFAVLPKRSFDVDLVIRKSLIYGALAAVLAIVYVAVGVIAAQRVAVRYPRYVGAFRILAIALPVILYTPARRWIDGWVDRTFFKVQFKYAQALLAFQDAVRGAPSQEEIAALCRRFIEEQLLVGRTIVLARRGEAFSAAGDVIDADLEAILSAVAPSEESRRLLAFPNSTSRPDLESDDFPAVLTRGGFKLALPVSTNGRCLGAILAGEKRSERRFAEEDLKLLYAVRAEAATVLQRVELVQRAAEEAHEREKAGQLEIMNGQSRLGCLGSRVEPGRVDLLPLIHEVIAGLKPQAVVRNIRFEVSVAPDLTPVRGDRNQVFQVVSDLLANAMRHSPEGQTVDVALMRGAVQAGNHPDGEARFVCVLPEWKEA